MTSRPPSEEAVPTSSALTPAWPERAAWGTATQLRAWQTAALTDQWHHRTGQAHGVTHAALRKELGGPAAVIANAAQLDARINRLREWASRPTG